MKKLVLASVMALASLSLVPAPTLRAQDQITIKDPTEFNDYSLASTQSDPKAKAKALEDFLTKYPQSVMKNTVLDMLLDAYQAANDPDHELAAAKRLLQVDPNNLKAIFISVYLEKLQCGKTSDAQACDDAAALAQKGLVAPKPAKTSADDWKKLTGAAYPIFHSAIALDDAIVKKDFKAAIAEYTAELMLYTDAQSQSTGLNDTLLLAQAYTQPSVKDYEKACWFYARVWNYAGAFRPKIEPELERWYKKYHGKLDGLDDIKAQAAKTTFPPGTFKIPLAPTPAEQIHDLLETTKDWNTLALADKETVLALGSKEDAERLWALLKDKATPVPGLIIDASASALKVSVYATKAGKPAEFTVKLTAPAACTAIPPASADVASAKAYILANGAADDTGKIEALAADYTKPVAKISIEGLVSSIKMAVTDDAKDAKTADFIVNLKEPAACKEVLAAGPGFGLQAKGETELDGTYDNYKQIPATDTTAQTAEIVLREGSILAEKKKPVQGHKPPAGHAAAGKKPAAH